jgi:hypothetical protein
MSHKRLNLWNGIHILKQGVLLWLVGLSACAAPSAPTHVPCVPNDSANIYNVNMLPEIRMVVEQATSYYGLLPVLTPQVATQSSQGQFNTPPAALTIPSNAIALPPQQNAFIHLLNETKVNSDWRTFSLDNLNNLNVIITFLSPKLIQTAYLNDFLYRGQKVDEFETRMRNALLKVINRKELIFLVTIISNSINTPGATPHVLDIPIDQLMLMNSANLEIKPGHDEHNIDQPFNTLQEPEAGLLGYPIGISKANECAWTLDPIYDTNIVFIVNSITLDGADTGSHTWVIPYTPLVVDSTQQVAPLFTMQSLPSIPSTLEPRHYPPKDMAATDFWSQYALFIWHKITLGNY